MVNNIKTETIIVLKLFPLSFTLHQTPAYEQKLKACQLIYKPELQQKALLELSQQYLNEEIAGDSEYQEKLAETKTLNAEAQSEALFQISTSYLDRVIELQSHMQDINDHYISHVLFHMVMDKQPSEKLAADILSLKTEMDNAEAKHGQKKKDRTLTGKLLEARTNYAFVTEVPDRIILLLNKASFGKYDLTCDINTNIRNTRKNTNSFAAI